MSKECNDIVSPYRCCFSCRLLSVQTVRAKKRSEDVQEKAVGGLQGQCCMNISHIWSCNSMQYSFVKADILQVFSKASAQPFHHVESPSRRRHLLQQNSQTRPKLIPAPSHPEVVALGGGPLASKALARVTPPPRSRKAVSSVPSPLEPQVQERATQTR